MSKYNFRLKEEKQIKDTCLGNEWLQQPLYCESPDFQTFGVPFQNDGWRCRSHTPYNKQSYTKSIKIISVIPKYSP